MKYLATAFSLTLGAWRLRVRIDLEDEPDDRTAAMQTVQRHHARIGERA